MRPAENPPTWATNSTWASGAEAGLPTKTEPSAGEKAEGLHFRQRPAARKLNWLLNLLCTWVGYLWDARRSRKVLNWTRTRVQDVPTTAIVGRFSVDGDPVASATAATITATDAPDFIVSSGKVRTLQRGRYLVTVTCRVTSGSAGTAQIYVRKNTSSHALIQHAFSGAGAEDKAATTVIEIDDTSDTIDIYNDSSFSVSFSFTNVVITYIGPVAADTSQMLRAVTHCPTAGYAGTGAWVFGGDGARVYLANEPTTGVSELLSLNSAITSVTGLASSASKVAAVGGGGNNVAVWSAPGYGGGNLTATSVSLPAGFGGGTHVVYSPEFDRFVVVGGTNKVAYSNSAASSFSDGTISGTWGASVSGVAVGEDGAGNERIVAVGQSLERVLYSDDGGETWTVSDAVTGLALRSVAYSASERAWLGLCRDGSNTTVWRSSNGITWMLLPTVPIPTLLSGTERIACDGESWLLVQGAQVVRSFNAGATWRGVPLFMPAGGYHSVHHVGGRFVIFATSRRDAFVTECS